MISLFSYHPLQSSAPSNNEYDQCLECGIPPLRAHQLTWIVGPVSNKKFVRLSVILSVNNATNDLHIDLNLESGCFEIDVFELEVRNFKSYPIYTKTK